MWDPDPITEGLGLGNSPVPSSKEEPGLQAEPRWAPLLSLYHVLTCIPSMELGTLVAQGAFAESLDSEPCHRVHLLVALLSWDTVGAAT